MNGKNETRIRNRYYARLREVLEEPGVNRSEENGTDNAENERKSLVEQDMSEELKKTKMNKDPKPKQEQQER